MPNRIHKLLAFLFLLGAIGGFGLSARRNYQVQDTTRYGAPVGPVRTVTVGKGDRIFFVALGVACLVGSAVCMVRTR